MRSLTALGSVLAILVSSCRVAQPLTEPLDEFPVAWMVTSCSPVDGPAVELFLGHTVPGEASNPSGPLVRIAIDRSAEAVRGNRYTTDDDPPSIFVAQHCVDRNLCQALTSVAVEFDRSGDTSHEYGGQLQITLPDGPRLEGTFHAELHEPLILCG
jgi:hypothetical protein